MKTKLSRSLVLFLAVLPLGACVTQRTLIMATPVASMTLQNSKADKNLAEGKDITERYCTGDSAMSTKANNIGVIDELVYRAQKDTKARFIKEVQIFAVNHDCWELEGKAVN